MGNGKWEGSERDTIRVRVRVSRVKVPVVVIQTFLTIIFTKS
jgi:hypothetical protein